MLNIREEILPTVNRPSIGGKSVPVEIRRGVKSHSMQFHLRLDVTIVGAAGGAVRAEGTQSVIETLYLKENGKPKIELSGLALAYFSARGQRQAPSVGVLANAAAQANTILDAYFTLEFASLFGADPSETCYAETDARYPTTLEVEWSKTPEAVLITGTGLTLNAATLEVMQEFDPNSNIPPFFLPRITRKTSEGIAAVQNRFKVLLFGEGANRIESVLLHSLVDGFSSDLLLTGAVTLRGDKQRYIDEVGADIINNTQRRSFDNPVVRRAYTELWLRKYGKLSEMLLGKQDDNLRVECGVAAPGTSRVFDMFLLEKEVVPGYTRELPAGW